METFLYIGESKNRIANLDQSVLYVPNFKSISQKIKQKSGKLTCDLMTDRRTNVEETKCPPESRKFKGTKIKDPYGIFRMI